MVLDERSRHLITHIWKVSNSLKDSAPKSYLLVFLWCIEHDCCKFCYRVWRWEFGRGETSHVFNKVGFKSECCTFLKFKFIKFNEFLICGCTSFFCWESISFLKTFCIPCKVLLKLQQWLYLAEYATLYQQMFMNL